MPCQIDDRPVISRRRKFPVKYKAIKDDRERKSSKSRRRIITLLNTRKWIVMAECQHTGLCTSVPRHNLNGRLILPATEAHPYSDKRTHDLFGVFFWYLTSKYVRLVNIRMCKEREKLIVGKLSQDWSSSIPLTQSLLTSSESLDRSRRKDAKPELPIDRFNLLPFFY